VDGPPERASVRPVTTIREDRGSDLRVALAGAGNACPAHIQGLSEQGVRIAGIHDLDVGKARAMAGRFRIGHVYPDYRSLLADPAVDVVAVITPPGSHGDLVVQALRAGKHVVCEKPMADSLRDCRAMVRAARRAGHRLFVVQNRVYTDAMEEMGRRIRAGDIGDVLSVTTEGLEGGELLDRMPSLRRDRRGVMGTQMMHQLYVVPFLTGQEPELVSAMTASHPGSGLVAPDGTAAVTVRYRGFIHNMIGTFERGSNLNHHRVRVIGTRGELRSERVGAQEKRRELLYHVPHGGREELPVELENPSVRSREFGKMWGDYLGAIAQAREPRMTTATAMLAMQGMDRMYRSARRHGRPTPIASPLARAATIWRKAIGGGRRLPDREDPREIGTTCTVSTRIEVGRKERPATPSTRDLTSPARATPDHEEGGVPPGPDD
jgi:predicted dehydrogenase